MPQLLRYYCTPGLSEGALFRLKERLKRQLKGSLDSLSTERCFYIEVEGNGLTEEQQKYLKWILSTPFEEDLLTNITSLTPGNVDSLIEIGPRLNFSTAFSTNCVSICQAAGLSDITRVEYSIRFVIQMTGGQRLLPDDQELAISLLHDRMTQCQYLEPLTTFKQNVHPKQVYDIDVLTEGRKALEKASKELGLNFDDWDLSYYTNLFVEKVKRNPTSVECFDLAQSNSEHSRHWFFRGHLKLDGQEFPYSLFNIIMKTQDYSNANNIIKFNDNSSAIKGYFSKFLTAGDYPSQILQCKDSTRHIIFTAETHNFPTGVAPFPGATTGTGGRIRDVQCTGRGAHVVAGTAGYSFGNLLIPGYDLEWEDKEEYPANMAPPVEIAVEASNGASDYGNKFGEPLIAGFARSFGMRLPNGERREYIKPIMFSGGIGTIDDSHVKKMAPEQGMKVVKIGGPVYRIGVGGGSASSVLVQGDNKVELDFNAVQRGDAEMEQKLNRVLRFCIEQQATNPICSIHDQGAGGNGNVLKELAEPAGAKIFADQFQLGDPTISVLELWCAEYQESNALLVKPSDLGRLVEIGARERCPVSSVGVITGSGKIQFLESENCTNKHPAVDLDLADVLGSMPRKEFQLKRSSAPSRPITAPYKHSIQDCLNRVLRLPSVASKRYLTNKVDRSVTGLIAQQQCVGPLHTPLADVAVIALSYQDTLGAATAIGEQPIKGLLNPAAGARMSVAEALTNLCFATITDLRDVKCSGNWMWAVKDGAEYDAAIVEACQAMCHVMKQLGIAVDGGKDSLSMAARVGNEVVRAPGTLVISAYAASPDITATVTPDLKCPGSEGRILWVSLSGGRHRLGGTALAQCFKELGSEVPDLDSPAQLVNTFETVQKLITERKLTAGHDISDGGLIVCLLEMAFAGNCGIEIDIQAVKENKESANAIDVLFAEEIGLVLEVGEQDVKDVIQKFVCVEVDCFLIGKSLTAAPSSPAEVSISVNGSRVLHTSMTVLRDVWEQTSFILEMQQTNAGCVRQEQDGLSSRRAPSYMVAGCDLSRLSCSSSFFSKAPLVAILREEGSNGDREMAAAFYESGFEVWDVHMQDLLNKKVNLDMFRGLAFVGGFSYADVCGSAKGWAATAKYSTLVRDQLTHFKNRPETFSIGVCNGCQLMAMLGWVASAGDESDGTGLQGVLLDHNLSERYESRFSTLKVSRSPAIMLKGMEGTTFGMWVSHGEGRMVFRNKDIHKSVVDKHLVPLYYVDDDGHATTTYPLNPNGSPGGIAALCSPDGRHFAVMPHPERSYLSWQCPWMPYEMRLARPKYSPWIMLFQNARQWCEDFP